jgi:hypothetical protein
LQLDDKQERHFACSMKKLKNNLQLLIGGAGVIINCGLRMLINNWVHIIFFASAIQAITQPMIMNAAPSLAAKWFAPNQASRKKKNNIFRGQSRQQSHHYQVQSEQQQG